MQPTSHIPGPLPTPLLGLIGDGYAFVRDPIGMMGQRFDAYGPIVGLIGERHAAPDARYQFIFVRGPELNQQIVTRHEAYHKLDLVALLFPPSNSERRQTLAGFMSGLFHVNGEEHRRHRRLLMPAFHKGHIATYHQDMVGITQDIVRRWQPGQILDIQEEMRLLTMRIVIKTLFGEDVADDREGIGYALQESMTLAFKPASILLPVDLPGFPYHRMLSGVMRVTAMIRDTIRKKREAGAPDDDLISLLIRSQDEDGNTLTEEELIGHAEVIFGAGHETSSTALSWTLFLLAQHPSVTGDLFDELAGTLHGDPPAPGQLADLPFLDAVIKESMRVLPPVPFNSRVAAHPTELGGYPVGAGLQLFISIYHTHHMPELFPNPEAFDPYRWETIKPGPFAYNPFSTGPRMCIGASFAMMELKIALAIIMQRFRLEMVPNGSIDRNVGITLSTQRSLLMRAHPQDQAFERSVAPVRGNIREMVELASER